MECCIATYRRGCALVPHVHFRLRRDAILHGYQCFTCQKAQNDVALRYYILFGSVLPTNCLRFPLLFMISWFKCNRIVRHLNTSRNVKSKRDNIAQLRQYMCAGDYCHGRKIYWKTNLIDSAWTTPNETRAAADTCIGSFPGDPRQRQLD